ncbi:MAG: hypothetical protein ACTS4U_00950 [Candidatus Hodgkinia cicadicola]
MFEETAETFIYHVNANERRKERKREKESVSEWEREREWEYEGRKTEKREGGKGKVYERFSEHV